MRPLLTATAGLWFALMSLCNGPACAGDWPRFRGPSGNGIADETKLPDSWGPEQNVKWKVPLNGTGNGSPIVSNGRVFVTAATDRGSQRTLYCFDRRDGRELWRWTAEFEPGVKTHQANPYCGSTPAANGERVVVWHGSAGLYCYDFGGKLLWKTDPGDVEHIWGYGSSPVIYGNRVLLNFGPGEQSFLMAADLSTGRLLWKTEEPGGANTRSPRMVGSWSTPVVAQVQGEDQILCSMPTRVVAYDPDDGTILWTCSGLSSDRGDLVYTSPLIAGDLGVAMGGYQGPAIAFQLGGTGDVTDTGRLWQLVERQPQRIGSGVVIGDYIYMANAGPAFVQCIELKTGKEMWRERVPDNHWGSVVCADGKLYVTDQRGTTHVFRPNPERFDLIGSNSLGEPSNATPAISDGELFLRTAGHLYCIAGQTGN